MHVIFIKNIEKFREHMTYKRLKIQAVNSKQSKIKNKIIINNIDKIINNMEKMSFLKSWKTEAEARKAIKNVVVVGPR